MKLTQLTEQEERPYICVHTKKGKHETHATSSYDAAKNAADHWGMKSTAGITAKLADVEHVAEEVITEGPCDIATKDDISKMSGEEYDKYAQWKKDCEAEERTTPLSTKRLESESDFDDYEGDMSQEEYDQTVDDSEMEYTVWVGGTEVNDHWLNYEDAVSLYDKYKAQGYDDIQLDARMKVKEGSFWGRDDMVKKMKDDEKARGMKRFRKTKDGATHGHSTSDPKEWKKLIANGYEEVTEGELPPKRSPVIAKKDGYTFLRTESDIFNLEYNGTLIASGDYDSGSGSFWMDNQNDGEETPGQTSFDSGEDVIDYYIKHDITEPAVAGAVNEGDEEELYFNYEDIGGNIIVNPKSTIEDQIGDLLDEYYGIGPDEFDPSKIEITSSHPSDEDLARNEERTDEFLPALAIGGIAGALMSDRKAKRDAEQLNAEEGDDEAEATAARDEFMKVMDMKPKGGSKAIDTIKKIVADRQNQSVKFDDGKMKVDLFTANAVSQVYDAVKPETREKIDNMLKTKEGMLKMANFAMSSLKEGKLKEFAPLAAIPAVLGAVGRGIAKVAGSAVAKKVAGAAVKTAIKHPVKTHAAVSALRKQPNNDGSQSQYESKAELEGYAPGMHPNSIATRAKPGLNKKKTPVAVPMAGKKKPGVKKPIGVGRGNGAGSKATQIKPGVKPAAGGVKPAAGGVKPAAGGVKKPSLLGKVAKGAGALARKIGNPLTHAASQSGFGNPLSASKQYADDMVEKAMKDAEEMQEISMRPAPKFKVSGPHGQKPGSHHPPAKSKPRFKASVKF